MTDQPTPADIAVAFTEAWGRGDLDAAAAYVADDIAFEGPLTQLEGKAAYFEALGQFAQAVSEVRIIAAAGDDEQALVMYDMVTGPFGTLRAAERLVVRDGRIVTDTLVFDTYEVRKARGTA